ncbi:MAG: hypothetical protein GVY12_13365 [Bacteroidetes bacterium]|jgi:tetratricopeptide (TPR) repeat protein|nr:hypothetical protein [Bacteroidota bacterium]
MDGCSDSGIGRLVRKRLRVLLLVVVGIGLLGLRADVAAGHQAQTVAPADKTHEEAYREALALLQEGEDPEAAIALLQPIVATRPLYRQANEGSVAFWLAEAYARAGYERQAFVMRRMGARAALQENEIDWWLVDAFVRDVFQGQHLNEYLYASELYMRALQELPANGPDRLMRTITTHLAAAAVLLSDGQRAQTGTERPTAERLDEGWQAPPQLPAYLAAWWRREDPDLITTRNERLEEHLERLAHAWDTYRPEGQLDDRAFVFLRLGEPKFTTAVRFDTPQMRERVINEIPGVTTFDFRDNEVWSFRHIDRNATYLFAEIDKRYYEVEVLELLPRRLRRGFSSSARGQRESQATVYALYETYKTLSTYSVEYGTRFSDVSNYLFDLDMQRLYGGQTQVVPESPATVAARETSRARTEDAWFVQQRERTVPDAESFVLGDMPEWDYALRSARFLEPDGRTRTEVYWGLDTAGIAQEKDRVERLGLTPANVADKRLLQSVLVHRADNYAVEAQGSSLQQIDVRRTNGQRTGWVEGTDTVVAAIEEDDAPYHVGLQWNGHLLGEVLDPDALTMESAGPLTSLTQHRIDSLRTLDASGTTLEMSDLKPLRFDDPTADPASAPPYPYATLGPATPVAVYFELYYLTVPDGGKARYTVAYELVRRNDRGLLARTFTEDIPDRSVTTLSQESTQPRTDELILIDWQDTWEAGTVELTVRVTDEATGVTKERTLQFEISTSSS